MVLQKAEKQYDTRLKNRLKDLEQLHASIKKHQQELEQSKIELEKSKQDLAKVNQQLIDILNKVSVQDVKTKENIRKLVIETKAMFFKYGTSSINPHIDQLFSLVP
ncbi:MAG: hypothetical protein WCL02_06160 [bacterium]